MKIRYILFYLVMAVCHLANANIYQVSDIQIMAEQETTAAARDVAILQGQTDAFWKLMQRMVLPENQEKIPYPNQTELNSWVKTFSLSDEKTTPTKYMARISGKKQIQSQQKQDDKQAALLKRRSLKIQCHLQFLKGNKFFKFI